MPRKSTPETTSEPATIESKLDEIILYLHRMERRDRMRMIGTYIHSMIWLASVLLLFWSSWYFVVHGPEMIKDMTQQMLQQSMGGGSTTDEENSGGYMKMIEDYMKGQ